MVFGSLVWTSRLNYSPESDLQKLVGAKLITLDPEASTDLSEVCANAESEDGWVLFVVDTQLLADNKFRTYFETAEEPISLWMEYDNGLLRLSQGLGSEGPISNTEIPIRIVRNDESAFIAIGVWREGTRVVTNAVDKSNSWPQMFSGWSCDTTQVGSDNRALSGGFGCPGCKTQIRYVSGTNVQNLQSVLDDLSNVKEFNVRRMLGTAITLAGVLLLLRGKVQMSKLLRVTRRPRPAGHPGDKARQQ